MSAARSTKPGDDRPGQRRGALAVPPHRASRPGTRSPRYADSAVRLIRLRWSLMDVA